MKDLQQFHAKMLEAYFDDITSSFLNLSYTDIAVIFYVDITSPFIHKNML